MTIFALFEAYDQADQTINQLLEQDFDQEDINAITLAKVAKNELNNRGVDLEKIKYEKSSEGNGQNVHGLEAMFGGEKAVNLPDVGQVVAAGPVADVLVNTAAAPGSAAGGLKKALIDFSVPAEAAEQYREGIVNGGLLIFVRPAQDLAASAANILRSQGASHLGTYG